MSRKLSILFFLLAMPLWVQSQAPAPAQPATPAAPLNLEQEMEQLYSAAVASFNQGSFDVVLQKIAAIHEKTNNRDFERVMFLEGAAHYNLEQYDKAAAFLQQFVSKFPSSEVVHEAKMSLGKSLLKLNKEDEGIKILKEVASIPTLRDQAGLEIAYYYKSKSKPDQASSILDVILKDVSGAPTEEQQQAILMAAEIAVSKGDSDKASAMIEKLRAGASAEDSIVQLNNLGVKVGDAMMEQKRYGEALLSYQSVRRQSEIVRIQKERVGKIEQWIKQIAAGRRVYFMGRQLSKEEADSLLAANKGILDELNKIKDYDAAIYYKLGQCFYEMGRFYESLLAFTEIYEQFRDFPDRHRSLFGMIVCNAALKRSTRAYALCEQYMNLFPEGPNIAQVTDMFGSLAYESGNINAAVRAFQRALSAPGADKERLNFLLGVVLFESQQFDDSRAAFQALLDLNKDSPYKDDASYRVALTYFFENDSVGARRSLKDYVANNPKGQFVVDAKYRLAFIEFQSANTGQGGSKDSAREQLETLIKEAPNDPNIGQVHYLLGDIYSQMPLDPKAPDKYSDLALAAYRNAVDKAKSEDVLNFGLEAANNMMVDRGMWKEIADMWSSFYNANKGKPEALKAIYWISRAKEREAKVLEGEGKQADAQARLLDARKLVAEAAFPYLGNPANEQVELLVQQLVSMIVPKRKARNNEAGQPTVDALGEEFKKLLLPEGDKSVVNGTAAARVLYGRALVAKSMRDIPKFDNLIGIIPDAASADEMSPMLLATLGEMLNKKGDTEKAAQYFNTLRERYPTSEYADKAPVGLAEIEFGKKEYQKALDLYNEAIQKYAASSSLLDATLGKAKCLFALQKIDQAEELYKTIFATRDWRGEAHAIALYMQGQIAEARKEPAKAISFYQRVYLSQQRYKPWVAKAYLQAARCSVEISKREDAVTLLNQMLARDDIRDQPAFREAQEMLGKINA